MRCKNLEKYQKGRQEVPEAFCTKRFHGLLQQGKKEAQGLEMKWTNQIQLVLQYPLFFKRKLLNLYLIRLFVDL